MLLLSWGLIGGLRWFRKWKIFTFQQAPGDYPSISLRSEQGRPFDTHSSGVLLRTSCFFCHCPSTTPSTRLGVHSRQARSSLRAETGAFPVAVEEERSNLLNCTTTRRLKPRAMFSKSPLGETSWLIILPSVHTKPLRIPPRRSLGRVLYQAPFDFTQGSAG